MLSAMISGLLRLLYTFLTIGGILLAMLAFIWFMGYLEDRMERNQPVSPADFEWREEEACTAVATSWKTARTTRHASTCAPDRKKEP